MPVVIAIRRDIVISISMGRIQLTYIYKFEFTSLVFKRTQIAVIIYNILFYNILITRLIILHLIILIYEIVFK